MATKTVTFQDWTFEVDYERNKALFDHILVADTERCGCAYCRNFSANRDQLYPAVFRAFLLAIGVDYTKETEVYQIAHLESGLHQYGGWFNFKGRMLAGQDGKIALPTGGWTFDLTEVEGSFRMVFLQEATLHPFEDEKKEDLLQIEFMVDSIWVIDNELENE